jgi:hypothetical protein
MQICHEFERFTTYFPNVKVGNFFGGLPLKEQKESLKKAAPSIVVGTPGRIKQVSITFSHFKSYRDHVIVRGGKHRSYYAGITMGLFVKSAYTLAKSMLFSSGKCRVSNR